MAVKAMATINAVEAFPSPTSCTLRVLVHVPANLGPFTSDPEGSLLVTLDPSGLSAGNNQAIRDAVKAWVQQEFPTITWVNGVDSVRLLGSF